MSVYTAQDLQSTKVRIVSVLILEICAMIAQTEFSSMMYVNVRMNKNHIGMEFFASDVQMESSGGIRNVNALLKLRFSMEHGVHPVQTKWFGRAPYAFVP